MTVEPLRDPPHLRLVDTETGEVHEDQCPGCRERDERIARLEEAVQGLTEELGVKRAQLSKLKRQLHRNLELDPLAESVKRVYRRYIQVLHPRTRRREIPADWLKMGIDRMKPPAQGGSGFSEEEMLRAVDGAATRWATNPQTGRTYDRWDNIFRSTSHVERYIEYADRAEEEWRRQMPRGMRIVSIMRAASLYDGHRSTDKTAVGTCPVCRREGFKVDLVSGVFLCREGCFTEEIDVALEQLADAYGLREVA